MEIVLAQLPRARRSHSWPAVPAKRPADANWARPQPHDRRVALRTAEEESLADIEVFRLEWPSVLQRQSVTARTRELYLDAWLEFKTWINSASRPTSAPMTAEELDRTPVRFFDVLYRRGKHVSHGERLLSAACFLHPRLGRQHGQWLCGSRQALRGWSRLTPKRSRLPLPWEIVCLIVNWLVTRGF